MRTIWKYPMTDGEELVVQGGARLEVRHIGIDPAGSPELPCVWVGLDPDEEINIEEIALVFIGTGQSVPDGEHVGSCVASGGFVWHVFEIRRNYITRETT